LGDVRANDTVLTVGPRGSKHALSTATYARLVGAQTTVVRWNQEMNAAARAVDARLRRECRVIDAKVVPLAYAVAAVVRLQSRTHWIPAGGASSRAVLGHINGAMEFADQLRRDNV